MIQYPKYNIVISELKKGLDRIGLSLSESQVNDLNMGKIVLLEDMQLSQMGSVLIMASAFFATNQADDETAITFKDLPKKTRDCSSCKGIPLCCCKRELSDEICCVYLTFINGIPALTICCRLKAISIY